MGTLKNLLKSHLPKAEAYDVTKYKYAVILTGSNGEAGVDRLSRFLAHSGSVILLQEHEFAYTYGSFLKPWVHYVPISYTTADIVDKIEFLINHPILAERLAINARNFGISHLRFEDYMCYVASSLYAISNITSSTDANIPFKPKKVDFPDDVY